MRMIAPPLRLALLLGALLLALVSVFACHKKFESGLPVVELSIQGVPVLAELASTAEARTTGLMFRHDLCSDCGMLFVFPKTEVLSFWMKNTYVPLSIAFLDEKGVILNVEDMAPQNETSHRSKAPARYALEMNQGWFAKKGLGPGNVVTGIPTPTD